MALLVCAVGGFTFSGKLAKTYKQHASENSSLACDIDLPGCSNCSVVPEKLVSCDGVMVSADGYWASCPKKTNSSSSECREGMTVLNAKEDQGFEANDVRTFVTLWWSTETSVVSLLRRGGILWIT